MKLAMPIGNGRFELFTNDGLHIGDQVFPLVNGYSHKGQWYLTGTYLGEEADMIFACTGWRRNPNKREPHTIEAFYPSDGQMYARTDRGYSPVEVYFKPIKQGDQGQ